MNILSPKELTWVKGAGDDPKDLCAHGKVHFEIDNKQIVSIKDGEWTVSAAALYLLRTLEKSHTQESPLFEHVFPCCGFSMYDVEGEDNVVICGCPNGIDFQVFHVDEGIKIRLEDDFEYVVSKEAWCQMVVSFSEAVQKFYSDSSSKIPYDAEDKKGFEKFINEWKSRHEDAVKRIL